MRRSHKRALKPGTLWMEIALDLDARRAPKRARFLSIVAFVPLLFLAAESFAAPITVPTTLPPGAQYRLAFVTAGTRTATSPNIADYDAFVQAEANTEAALSSISWQVIGSTATVSARDHTATDPSGDPAVPIFLLNGVKLVDDYADLWDGTLDGLLAINQHGDSAFSVFGFVYTGTLGNGLMSPYTPLGNQSATTIGSNASLTYWVDDGPVPADLHLPLYGLSNVLTVPAPEASTTALLALGLSAVLLGRRVLLR